MTTKTMMDMTTDELCDAIKDANQRIKDAEASMELYRTHIRNLTSCLEKCNGKI